MYGGFFYNAKEFIINPLDAFHRVKDEELGVAFGYFIFWLTISRILSGIVVYIWGFYKPPDVFKRLGMASFKVSAISHVITLISVSIALGIIGIFIIGAWLHFWIRRIGGYGRYPQTIKAMIYGDTPSYLFGWIPLIGMLAGIWSFVLLIFGIKEMHGLAIGRGAAAVILSIVILLVIIFAIFFIFFLFLINSSSFGLL